MERTVNVAEYHDVIAQSLREITANTVSNTPSSLNVVRELCIANILQAYTIYVTDAPEHETSVETKLEELRKKNEKAQIYDVIVNDLKAFGIYTKEGLINEELALDRLKILMYYYQCKIGVKPSQKTDTRARTYERVQEGLYRQ